MARPSAAERERIARELTAWIRARVLDPESDVAFAVETGLRGAVGNDLGLPRPQPNGSATLVVRINGGARLDGAYADDWLPGD